MCAYNIYIIYSDIVQRGGISLILWTEKTQHTTQDNNNSNSNNSNPAMPYNNNHGHKITIGEVGGIWTRTPTEKNERNK